MERELSIDLGEDGRVSAVALLPDDADVLFVYAHGAGAPMRHAFMEASSAAFAERRIATLRFNFLYAEAGRRAPDRPPRLCACLRAAVTFASSLTSLPFIAGGKSMGGRMSSHAALEELGARGLAFVGYPLHPPGKPGTSRAENLQDCTIPMLFLQGTRDKLARLDLMEGVCQGLGDKASLHVVEGADHGFHVLKRSGRTDDEVLVELADELRHWIDEQVL